MSNSSVTSENLKNPAFDEVITSGYLKTRLTDTLEGSAVAKIILTDAANISAHLKNYEKNLSSWQKTQFQSKEKLSFTTESGPVFLLSLQATPDSVAKRNRGLLLKSPYGKARDQMGALFAKLLKEEHLTGAELTFDAQAEEVIVGSLVGIEMASYSYLRATKKGLPKLNLKLENIEKNLVQRASAIARGVNLARHLVNLPPNLLYPESYANLLKVMFEHHEGLRVEVWDEAKLAEENMNLHLAVGRASARQPRLVKLSYRPSKITKDDPVTTFVGKGITFDSGGLDLKPAANMRLMKKDMGGSAAIAGTVQALLELGIKKPMDIYLPMAENAISSEAFRPSDVFTGRNGKTVEIHNTDAEGRLILADSLALAKEEADKVPTRAIINVATLTGAIKVGLGVGMGGFMSNDPELSERIQSASQKSSDFMWEVPFFAEYRSQLKSEFADLNHCGTGGYGGAITAGLYLLDYVDPCSFAHFDIYAWNDSPKGGLRDSGGSGQAVQCLIELMTSDPS